MRQSLIRPRSGPSVLMHRGDTLTFDDRPRRSLRMKRMLDLAIATPLGLLTLPLLAIAALVIRFTSRGPVLFAQARASSRTRGFRNGAPIVEIYPFRCLKLRTMCAHADEAIHVSHIKAYISGEAQSTDDGGFKVNSDDRVTRFGRLLRCTSIDELPQLFNVLRGDMSLVGPRPVPMYEVDEYPHDALERLLVKPGLTGLWQVEARSHASFDEMMALDIRYARSSSLANDLKLLARTIPCVLARRGAA